MSAVAALLVVVSAAFALGAITGAMRAHRTERRAAADRLRMIQQHPEWYAPLRPTKPGRDV